MSALAKYIADCGKIVAGSDITDSVYVRDLQKNNIRVCLESRRESVADFEVVVYTDAIRENDVQLCEARALGKCVVSRGQLLYEISRNFKKVIAISGCHGKTTCTSILAHIFRAADKNFTAHIGGRDLDFGNYLNLGTDYFITEACEYKKNFLLLKPDCAVVLNSSPDHIECYGSVENLKQSYLHFKSSAEIKVSLFGDMAQDGLTFGFDKNADYYAGNIAEKEGFYTFDSFERGKPLGKITLGIYGKHNILNALAAIAVSRSFEIPFDKISEGISGFKGVERRFETLCEKKGVKYIADYAHHPEEIRASVRTAKKITRGKVMVVFQPHTYSRTKNFIKQFVKVLSPIDNLLIYRTYAAREYYDDAGSALTLSQKIKRSRYGDSLPDIYDFISKAESGDLVLFLGAGDIYEIVKSVLSQGFIR